MVFSLRSLAGSSCQRATNRYSVARGYQSGMNETYHYDPAGLLRGDRVYRVSMMLIEP